MRLDHSERTGITIPFYPAGAVHISEQISELIPTSDLVIGFSEIDPASRVFNRGDCSFERELVDDTVGNQFGGVADILYLSGFIDLA